MAPLAALALAVVVWARAVVAATLAVVVLEVELSVVLHPGVVAIMPALERVVLRGEELTKLQRAWKQDKL
ncbi:hypothetical protein DM860_004220 [Cuscuta australis]|uniref:Secreted protein n=1 Tax=Cuscuta australis TaxID=267555 RepID=A0A328CXY3_9ASTE|nr:hypothetical protein DM860_004220 [Cuscuta australis]